MSAPPPRGKGPGRHLARVGRWSTVLVSLGLIGAACTQSGSHVVEPSGTATPPASLSPTASVSASPSAGPTGAAPIIASLPDGCAGGKPRSSATVAFVAGGRAWAAAPDGTGLTCLFEVDDPGPFAWGPRADRVVLGGLEVRGVGSDATRPAGSTQPGQVSWGRPKGLAIAFVDSSGTKLEKALVGGSAIQDVSPFGNVTYQDVVYHPSGLALSFVLTDSDGSSIWVSSNTGNDPKRLVWSKEGTVFGPLAWRVLGGGTLYYGALLSDGTHMLSAIDLIDHSISNKLWVGDQGILRLAPSPNGESLALDAGTGCADRQAVVSDLDGTAGVALLPGATAPTTVVGWLDQSTLLVGEGGCGQPMSIWRVDRGIAPTTVLFADGADRAAVRVPDPLPTPPLPDIGVNEGLG